MRDYDLTEIAPHYAHFTVWRRCLDEQTTGLLVSNVVGSTSVEKAFVQCSEYEDQLKSVLAQQIGLPRARALIKLARDDVMYAVVARFGRATPPPATMVEVADWKIVSLKAGVCMAVYSTLNTQDSDMTVILASKDEVQIGIEGEPGAGQRVPATPGESVQYSYRISKLLETVYSGEKPFRSLRLGNLDAYVTELDDVLVKHLTGNVYFEIPQLQRKSYLEGLGTVLKAMPACLQSGPL